MTDRAEALRGERDFLSKKVGELSKALDATAREVEVLRESRDMWIETYKAIAPTLKSLGDKIEKLEDEREALRKEVGRLRDVLTKIASLEVTKGAAVNLAGGAIGWPVPDEALAQPSAEGVRQTRELLVMAKAYIAAAEAVGAERAKEDMARIDAAIRSLPSAGQGDNSEN
jgi:predicted translin family RNA/ssDNA-binding protein